MQPIVITDRYDEGHPWAHLGLQVAASWDEDPGRDAVRDVLRDAGPDGVLVSGTPGTLNIVVEGLHRTGRTADVPVGFLAAHAPSSDTYATIGDQTSATVEALGIPQTLEAMAATDPIQLPLVRNDVGGVLLIEARCERPKLRPFGMQAYHDDALIADGRILGLTVVPDYSADDAILAKVTPARRGSIVATSGRAVQVACDDVPLHVDGRDLGAISKRTWYVDDRTHWLLRATKRADPQPDLPAPAGTVPGTERGLFRWVR